MDIHTLGAGARPQPGVLAKLTTPCSPRRKRKEIGLLDFSSQGLAWNPSRKVLIASPPTWFRVKELPLHLLQLVNGDLSSHRIKCHSQNVPETHT